MNTQTRATVIPAPAPLSFLAQPRNLNSMPPTHSHGQCVLSTYSPLSLPALSARSHRKSHCPVSLGELECPFALREIEGTPHSFLSVVFRLNPSFS